MTDYSEKTVTEHNDTGLALASRNETELFDAPAGYKGYLPMSVPAIYGCINCEWRGTDQCPYGFKAGPIRLTKFRNIRKKSNQFPDTTTDNDKGFDNLDYPFNTLPEGICQFRKDYLLLMTGEWEERPTLDLWQSRLMKNKGMVQNSKDEFEYMQAAKSLEQFKPDYESRLKELETQLEFADGKTEQKAINDKIHTLNTKLAQLKLDYQQTRANFIQTWEKLEGFFEKQVDRETTKHVNLDINKRISPMELGELMKEARVKCQDADYEEIDDE